MQRALGLARVGATPSLAGARRRTTDSAPWSPRTRRAQCCGPLGAPPARRDLCPGTSVPGPLPVAPPANSYRAPATCQAPRGRHRGHQDETATVSVLPRRATSYDDFKRPWKTAMFSHRWRVSPPLTVGDSNTQDPPPASCTRRGPHRGRGPREALIFTRPLRPSHLPGRTREAVLVRTAFRRC